MARPRRVDYPGALHHVIIKGNDGRLIFKLPDDKQHFLEMLGIFERRYGFLVYAYCLMDNHVHLLIETGLTPLSVIMQKFLTGYVQWFNRKWDKWGHLLGDRYKSILVDKDRYFLAVLRYIHLNPVKAGLVEKPEEYLWSSYREYLTNPDIIDAELGLSYFKGIKEFQSFHLEEIKDEPQVIKAKNILIYGEEDFISETLKKVEDEERKKRFGGVIDEDVVMHFLKEIFGRELCETGPYERNNVRKYGCVLLRERSHRTFKKIGELMGLKVQGAHKFYNKISEDEKNMILEEFDRWMRKQVKETDSRKVRRKE